MADKNPFGGLGLGQMGAERQYMGRSGLGSVAGLWLADKAGLIDLAGMDEEQKGQLQSQGVLGTILKNKLLSPKPAAPTGAVMPKIGDTSTGANYDIAPVKPPKLNATQGAPTGQQASYDHENIDQSLNNFANLLSPGQQPDQLQSRNPALDELPNQYAGGPIIPPTLSYPELPKSQGGLAQLLSAFA